jgi:cell division protein ZapB
MEAELKGLEDKIAQLVQLCARLRMENNQLRQQLANSENEGKHLTDKINSARGRLEMLLEQIPEDEA